MLVPRYCRNGVVLPQRAAQVHQGFILQEFKVPPFNALKFDAYGMVVAVVPAPVAGLPGVPCAVIAADKLLEFTLSANEKVGRYLYAFNTFEVGVLVPVKLIRK